MARGDPTAAAALAAARAALLGSLLGLALPAAPRAEGVRVVDPGQGNVLLETGDSGARQLSGLTRIAGDRYYAVSDKGGRLFPLRIAVDGKTGFVTETRVEAPIRLVGCRDLEGVAWDAESGHVFVVDEVGPSLREHRVDDGALVRRVEVPPVFRRARLGRSLESLALDAGLSALWTANEEALRQDGEEAGLERGSPVRIQRFDRRGAAGGQWVYVTEPIPGHSAQGSSRNGLAELLVLPSGELLALERSLGGEGLGARIFLLDFSGASDVSGVAALAGASFQAVRKTLLWETRGLLGIFEGMTLGPRLEGGDHSLLLVSDDGGFLAPSLYPLRVQATWRGAGPE